MLLEIVGGVAAGETFISWGQLTTLFTTIVAIVGSTSYLTRQLDRKLNIHDYEVKHTPLLDRISKLEVRMSLVEERYNVIRDALRRNGIRGET
jgi:hypothetical protein